MASSPMVCLSWTAAAMTLSGKMSKQSQEGGRRLEEGEANNEHWSMTQALWEQWSSHSWGGGGGLSPLSVPQSQIHSWYPRQKKWQWLASGRQCTPTPPPRTLTTIPCRAPGTCPSTWLRPSQRDTTPCPHEKKGTTKRFLRTQPAFNTTENTFHTISDSSQCLHFNKCLLWELTHHFFKLDHRVFDTFSYIVIVLKRLKVKAL